jgi:hypothetical protein
MGTSKSMMKEEDKENPEDHGRREIRDTYDK